MFLPAHTRVSERRMMHERLIFMLDAIKQEIQQEVCKIEDDLWNTAVFIHEHPELGTQEFQAVEKLTGLLAQHGFTIEQDIAGMKTAFRATYALNGTATPTIAYLAEYDALPEVGHACGHNLIGVMSVGAGIALSKIRNGLNGRIVVLGTPDEEGGGGKIAMVKQHVFDDIDAAMMIHPGSKNVKRKWNLAAFSVFVEFFGKPAHAAAKPFDGINALDAMIQLFVNVGLLRQQLTDDVRIHGIITHGGVAANIIPEYTRAKFVVRASELTRTYQVLEKFKNCVKAAALATGATERIHLDENSIYEPLLPNDTLIELYAQNMKRVGIDVEEQSPGELGGSSDIGNVSQVTPAIHPSLSIVSPGVDIPGHSREFALAAKSDLARIAMTKGIQALALCGSDLFGNIDVLNAVKAEFQQRTVKNAA